MAYDERLATRVRQFFGKRRVAFEEKRMMGGLCFMVEGKMCVGVQKERLMARIDPSIYEKALGRKGCVPMDFTGRPMRGFVFVNAEGLDPDRDLASWLELALEFNPRAVSSKKKKPAAQS
jgi:TfoX/Sxy family transcriptional regulator of competence genes